MDGFRTSSPLLSIIESAAGLVAGLRKQPDLTNLITDPGDASELQGKDSYGTAGALRVLLRALKDEAALSAFGRLAARWDIEQRLKNLCRLRKEEMRSPEIAQEPIRAPIFVTGLPRAGTTFLQTLLSDDPDNQVPRCWQCMYPYPDRPRPGGRDTRPERLNRQLRCFNLLAPDLHKVHPLNGSSPQECTEITAHVFQSLRFDSTHRVPSYRKWLDEHGHLSAYRFHKRFLQHLQHQTGRQRWILKSPDHVFALGALQSVYPDARVVFMHRDPVKVVQSNAQLIEILRAPFTRAVDRFQVGRQTLSDLSLGAAHMIEASRRGIFPQSQVFHLQFLDLISHPIDAVRRLYSHFGLPLGLTAEEQMSKRIAGKPNGGYAKNMYFLARHGLQLREVEQNFRDYIDHFDVQAELPASPIASARPSTLLRPPQKRAATSLVRTEGFADGIYQ